MKRLQVLQRHCTSCSNLNRSEDAESTITPHIVIIGGAVLDIQATATTCNLLRGGSVPGTIRHVPGGVGRNIAEGLGRLLRPSLDNNHSTLLPTVAFASVVGNDAAGLQIIDSLTTLGVSTKAVAVQPLMRTPSVSIIFDRSGEVSACVADLASLEAAFTPSLLDRHTQIAELLRQASVVVVEANLPSSVIQAVARTLSLSSCDKKKRTFPSSPGAPNSDRTRPECIVIMEPVSVPKSLRLLDSLALCPATFVTPNTAELMAMAQELRQRKDGGGGGSDNGGEQSEEQTEEGKNVREGKGREGKSRRKNADRQGIHPYHVEVVQSIPSSAVSSPLSATPPPSPSPPTSSTTPLPLPAVVLGAAAEVILAGAAGVILTMGSDGVALITPFSSVSSPSSPSPSPSPSPTKSVLDLEINHLAALPATVVNLSGAGDTFVAGFASAVAMMALEGRARDGTIGSGSAFKAALGMGVAAATRAVESASNVPNDDSFAWGNEELQEAARRAQKSNRWSRVRVVV
uniref:Carbohydrate kinase PfkB domain-containing protein n=1 Tax=Polytomella parva TaxID=51329 RepID=A0A7S0YEW3_9CHLO|mmetsp:Transcript_2292/g.3476  ORF Transcript_2292/g.3476 Transcript_2292/m.3476 type:complete len:517 (+) Transcript_2292:64-1614(+)